MTQTYVCWYLEGKVLGYRRSKIFLMTLCYIVLCRNAARSFVDTVSWLHSQSLSYGKCFFGRYFIFSIFVALMYLTFDLRLIDDIWIWFLIRKKFYVFSNTHSFKHLLSLKIKIYQDFYMEFKDPTVRFFFCSTVFCNVGNCKACSKS